MTVPSAVAEGYTDHNTRVMINKVVAEACCRVLLAVALVGVEQNTATPAQSTFQHELAVCLVEKATTRRLPAAT